MPDCTCPMMLVFFFPSRDVLGPVALRVQPLMAGSKLPAVCHSRVALVG